MKPEHDVKPVETSVSLAVHARANAHPISILFALAAGPLAALELFNIADYLGLGESARSTERTLTFAFFLLVLPMLLSATCVWLGTRKTSSLSPAMQTFLAAFGLFFGIGALLIGGCNTLVASLPESTKWRTDPNGVPLSGSIEQPVRHVHPKPIRTGEVARSVELGLAHQHRATASVLRRPEYG